MSSGQPRKPADRPQAADALRAVGAVLRDARLGRGESLDEVSKVLRIKRAYLAALEAGDLEALPGRTYVLGFVRNYAAHLGYDGEQAVEAARAAFAPVAGPERLCYETPEPEERRPGGLVIAASILLAGGLYLGWQMSGRDSQLLDRVTAMPGEVGRLASDMLEGPEPPAIREVTRAPEILPADQPLMLEARTDPVEAVPPLPPPEPAAGTARLQPAAALPQADGLPQPAAGPPEAAAHGADATSALAAELPRATVGSPDPEAEVEAGVEGGQEASAAALLASLGDEVRPRSAAPDGRVVLRARESSWIQVRSGNRDFVRTQTLQPGERFVLPERDDLALWTGNAGGLEIIVEGRSLGTLGQHGKVVRDVKLSPQALRERLERR